MDIRIKLKVLAISSILSLLITLGLYIGGVSTVGWAHKEMHGTVSRVTFGIWWYCVQYVTPGLPEKCSDMTKKPFNDSDVVSEASKQASALTSAGGAALVASMVMLMAGMCSKKSHVIKLSAWLTGVGGLMGVVGGLVFDLLLRDFVGSGFTPSYSTYIFFSGCAMSVLSLVLEILLISVTLAYWSKPKATRLRSVGLTYNSFGASESVSSYSYTSFT